VKLAKVIGTVVATQRHPLLAGQTTLLCEPVDPTGQATGPAFIAVDRANAGCGDLVLVNQEGNGARQMFGLSPKDRLPFHNVIVGVVDHVEERSEGARA
jgi:ethanolamine utilization protein EutN